MSPKISSDQKEQRRLQILDAGKRVFSAKGYGVATLKDIVEEAGMSRGWIYLYFQTKEEIFEAILDQQDLDYDKHLHETLQTKPLIWHVITEQFSQLQEELCLTPDNSLYPAFYEYFLTGWRDEERKALLLRRYDRGITRFANLLQLGVDQGEFKPHLPLLDIARMTASYQEGIITHSIAVGADLAQTQVQLQELVRYVHQLLNPKQRD